MNEHRELWAHGRAECFDCEHVWIAVWPLGCGPLECPNCASVNTDRERSTERADVAGRRSHE